MEENIKSKEKSEKVIPDKVVKKETEDTSSKTPKTESKGEYKEKAKEAMKGYFGKEVTDDNYDGMVETMANESTAMKEKMGKYDAANKNIMAMMEDEPELSGILADMSQGGKFSQVLPKYVDMQAMIDSKGGDETIYEENNKTRMANYDKSQAHKATMAKNEEKSFKVIAAFNKEMKLEGENADKFTNWIAEMLDKAYSNDITKEFLERMYHAMNYKKDVAMAEEIGKVSAKNTKIEEKTKSEAELKKGDSLPKIASADEKVAETEKEDFTSSLDRSLDRRKPIYGG